MNRIDDIFTRLRADGRPALMPFVTGGYPTLAATRDTLPALESAGASIVEIGIPLSDPIADGPVIAASMHEALAHGVTPPAIFDLVREVRSETSLGLVAMVSCSIVTRMGERLFVAQAAAAGFDGLIVPDTDTDCASGAASPAGRLSAIARDAGITCTFLVAPTSTEGRLEAIASISSGFIYVLARVGITGERQAAPEVTERVEAIRRHTDLPVAVGFGISTAEHVAAVTRHADAAIVGSALVRRMAEAHNPASAAASFVRDLSRGLASRVPAR